MARRRTIEVDGDIYVHEEDVVEYVQNSLDMLVFNSIAEAIEFLKDNAHLDEQCGDNVCRVTLSNGAKIEAISGQDRVSHPNLYIKYQDRYGNNIAYIDAEGIERFGSSSAYPAEHSIATDASGRIIDKKGSSVAKLDESALRAANAIVRWHKDGVVVHVAAELITGETLTETLEEVARCAAMSVE